MRHSEKQCSDNNHQQHVDASLGIRSNRYFSKTVAFQGQLQFFLIRETANQVKEQLLAQVGQEKLADIKDILSSSSLKDQREKQSLKNQNRLRTQQIHIIDFKPFFCDINDLNNGTSLQNIYKRQLICPFNLYINMTDMIEVMSKQVINIKKALRKNTASLGLNNQHSQKKAKMMQKQALMSDGNFKYFHKTEINLDLTEIKASFNDMMILHGISFQFNQMNKQFEAYMKSLSEQ